MITEVMNGAVLYDVTRPFVWKFESTTAANLVYVIQKQADGSPVFENISGLLRQPMEFGSNGEFLINPSEILADEIKTKIREKNEYADRVEFEGSIKWRLLMTEEVVTPNGNLVYLNNMNLWQSTKHAFAIDAATQHEETFGLNQVTWFDDYRIHPQTFVYSAKFLTNKPYADISMSVTDSEYAYCYINAKKHIFTVEVKNNNNNIFATYQLNNLSYGLNSIGIGVPNIISKIGQSNWDTIANNVHRVEYYVSDFGGARKTEIGSYKINKETCTTERLRVYWKNRKGGIDGYTFNSELEISTSTQSKLSKSYLGYRRTNSENDYNSMGYNNNNTYNQRSHTLQSTNIVANERLKVTSKHEKATILNWLSEIITSPLVWVENVRTGQVNSVYCITKKATTKPKGLGLGQMKLTLAMSNEITTQR
jgi:hypothetical protein